MKNRIQKTIANLFALILVATTGFAQDGKLLDIDINVDKTEWYENPYVWAGVAVFLVILALISRKSK